MPNLTEIPKYELRKVHSYDLTEKLLNEGHRLFRGEHYTPNTEICNYFLLEPNAKQNEGPFKLDYDRLSDLVRNTIHITNTSSTLPQDLIQNFYTKMLSSSEKLLPYLAEIIDMYDNGLIDINGMSGLISNKKLHKRVNKLKFLIERLHSLPMSSTKFQKTFDHLIKYSACLTKVRYITTGTDSQIKDIYGLSLLERQKLLNSA